MVLDGGQYLPPGRPPRVLGPPLDADRGLEVGVIRLDFPGRPRTVSLSLFGPDLIPAFEVTARRGPTRLPESAVGRVVRGRYDPAGLGLFREERITVRWSDGIDRISVDGWGPPGHLLLVGTIEIDP